MKTIKQQLEELLTESHELVQVEDWEALGSMQRQAVRLLINRLKKIEFKERELVLLTEQILNIEIPEMMCFCGQPAVCQECEHCPDHCTCIEEGEINET